jgi:inner membrane protein
MSPVTHFLTGWVVANTASLNRRDRALVTLAGVVPDIDGLGVIAEVLTRHSRHPLEWFSTYHHALHTLAFGLVVAGVSFMVARQRWKVAALTLLSFHLHLLEDLVGARGPDGYQWPIPYLMPFSHAGTLTWNGQWALNTWPNFLITGALSAATFYLAWRRGYSPIEMVSLNADSAFVGALRNRFPLPENRSA